MHAYYAVDVQAHSDSGRGIGDGIGTTGSAPTKPRTSWSSPAVFNFLLFLDIGGSRTDANLKPRDESRL